MELLEYIMFNFGQQNERAIGILTDLYENSKEIFGEEDLIKLVKALNACKGYTEYRVKDIANDLGFSKTKVKYLVKQLIEENKIELVIMENITFIKPIF
jgi:DNA-binding MarR family transcriptional regulator